MTDQLFTPHADSIQTAWVLMCQQSRIATQPPVEELEAEFDRFVAQVKRDAAREAVHGLVARWISEFGASDAYVDMIRDEANDYLSEIYPEETSR